MFFEDEREKGFYSEGSLTFSPFAVLNESYAKRGRIFEESSFGERQRSRRRSRDPFDDLAIPAMLMTVDAM